MCRTIWPIGMGRRAITFALAAGSGPPKVVELWEWKLAGVTLV
jgi:hypothetical protein